MFISQHQRTGRPYPVVGLIKIYWVG